MVADAVQMPAFRILPDITFALATHIGLTIVVVGDEEEILVERMPHHLVVKALTTINDWVLAVMLLYQFGKHSHTVL